MGGRRPAGRSLQVRAVDGAGQGRRDQGGLSPWITVWIGAVIFAVPDIAIGLPILRIRSMPHVAIVTLAFAEIARIALTNLQGNLWPASSARV